MQANARSYPADPSILVWLADPSPMADGDATLDPQRSAEAPMPQVTPHLAVPALLIFAAVAGAQGAERFAPAVGTEFEMHSTTVTTTSGAPDVHSEAWGAARVISDDGVLSTRQTRVIRTRTDRPGIVVPASDYSDDNYVTTMLFVPVVSASHPRNMGPLLDTVMVIRTECDRDALLGLLPLGRVPSVTVDCTSTQTVAGTAMSPSQFQQVVSYEGPATVSTPAGTFAVQGVGTSYQTGGSAFETHVKIDTVTGVTVRYETAVTSAGRRTQTVAELVALREH